MVVKTGIKQAGNTCSQAIWASGLMGSWFCVWNDLLRLVAIARVTNLENELNLVPNPF